MDTPKFTPGPWKLETHIKTAIGTDEKHIAMVNWFNDGTEKSVTGEEHEANAHLIAAAPDMYNLLERVLVSEWPWSMNEVEELLAKARGEK